MNFDLDEHGFLKNKDQWNELFVEEMAKQENISLTDEHKDIICFFRDFYLQHQLTPTMRVLLKHLKTLWPHDKANSLYVQHLFPKSVMLQASRLAGLPKPSRCL